MTEWGWGMGSGVGAGQQSSGDERQVVTDSQGYPITAAITGLPSVPKTHHAQLEFGPFYPGKFLPHMVRGLSDLTLSGTFQTPL